jgi:hypothetical protein
MSRASDRRRSRALREPGLSRADPPHVSRYDGPVTRRPLAAVAGLAASLSVVSLVLAEQTTAGQSHRVAVVFLFLVFLAAVFTLLAVAIIDSDRGVERLSEVHEVSPRWSLRAARRRLGNRLALLARNGLMGVARGSRAGVTGVARASRAGVTRIRRELEPERRRATRARLKENWYAALVVMGMPPKELEAASAPPSASESGDEDAQQAGSGIAQLGAALAARYHRAVPPGRGVTLARRSRALLKSRPAGRSPGGRPGRRTRASGSRTAGVVSVSGRRPLGGPTGS